ncbi:MAG: 3-phosphoshikimate 1-carboxyvinyltransferase [Clostridiales bacterium]|jgi:3-phosphoshikimate 1-carboxyvinyltransferase|nr:3-phosphoshikimate 1-carboxyvinyltransferase [Clostridiales bacterium]
MNKKTIQPHKLQGKLVLPPSKSLAHRAIICAGLARGESKIGNIEISDDIGATIDVMRGFGADIAINTASADVVTLQINGDGIFSGNSPLTLDCRESGTTLRLTSHLAPFYKGETEFIGSPRLMSRVDKSSSQHVSGKLLAAPLSHGDSTINIDAPLQSRGYVDLTVDMMEHAGIHVTNDNYDSFAVHGGQKYRPFEYTCEADFSQAAFFLVANALGSEVEITNLPSNSLQGDRVILEILGMGTHGNIEIEAGQFPDLVPILAVWSTFRDGNTSITNVARLRNKESNRLDAITRGLNALGAEVRETEDGLFISGRGADFCPNGGEVSGFNDHRIVMSLAIAATRAENPVIISDYLAVKKSYPNFWRDYERCCSHAF